MKKIVGILTVAAMATSLFAVDISGGVKAASTLMSTSTVKGEEAEFLTVGNPCHGHTYDGQTGLSFSASTEKAGAGFTWDDFDFCDASFDVDLVTGDVTVNPSSKTRAGYVWFKPIDTVKVTLGDLWYQGYGKEDCGILWNRIYGVGGNGYGINWAAAEGLSFDVAFIGGLDTPWYTDSKVQDTVVKAAYSADFGNAGVLFNYSNKTGDAYAMNIELSYGNTFGAVSMWSDVLLNVTEADNLAKVTADAYANYTADALCVKGYVVFVYDTVADDDNTSLGFDSSVGYTMGAYTPSLKVACGNVMADKPAITVKPQLNFNVGAASIETAVSFTMCDGETTIAVPFDVSVGL